MNKLNEAKLQKIWAQVPSDYYFRLNFLQNLWHDWKWMTLKHLMTTAKITPKNILEVGCSAGHLSSLVAKLYPKAQVYGIDIYQPAIIEARKRFPKLKFSVADAHKLPFKDKFFDFVVCSETIEHVVEPKIVLHEISRVLKPGGLAIVEMDSGSWLFRLVWELWTRYGRGKVWKGAHLHPFTAQELETLISGNGFLIENKMFSHFGMVVSFALKHRA